MSEEPAKRWLPSIVPHIAREISRLRSESRRRNALAILCRRHGGHLLDDVGLERSETGNGAPTVSAGERHRFWML